MSSGNEQTTLTPAISLIFSSNDSIVIGIFLRLTFLAILSYDLIRDLILSMGLPSYSKEYS